MWEKSRIKLLWYTGKHIKDLKRDIVNVINDRIKVLIRTLRSIT